MTKPVVRNTRNVLADVLTFVRSQEINRALATVTFEQLAQESIARNGRSGDDVGYSRYLVPSPDDPESSLPVNDGAATTGTFTSAPSKRNTVLSLRAALEATVEVLKSQDPSELVDQADTNATAGDTL